MDDKLKPKKPTKQREERPTESIINITGKGASKYFCHRHTPR